MPPRKRRTPSIITGFDKHYWCNTCDTQNLERHTDLDDKTWTCITCGDPIKIDLADAKGNSFTVERHQAQTLTRDDYVVLEHDLSLLCRVLASNPAMGRGELWYLALEGYGANKAEPDRYYNRIP